MKRRLEDVDSAERMMVLRIALSVGGPFLLGIVFLQYVLGASLLVWIVPDLVFIALATWLVFRSATGTGTLVNSLLMPSGTPPLRGYSEQHALVARGLIADAIDSYRSLIVAYPSDLDARLELAALLSGPGRDPVGAERCYLAVRAAGASPNQERQVGNALIDLYRNTDRRADLMAELARFARLNRGHSAGESARAFLQQLIEDDPARHG